MVPVKRNAVRPLVYLAQCKTTHRPVTHHHYHKHYHADTITYKNHYKVGHKAAKKMKSQGTQTSDGDLLAIPPHEKGTWKGFLRKTYRRCIPATRWLATALLFLASRINLGLGYRLSWLPFVGAGMN